MTEISESKIKDIIYQIELVDKVLVINNNLTRTLNERKIKLYKELEDAIKTIQ